MGKRYHYRKRLKKVSGGATDEDVKDDPVKPGRIHVIQHVSMCDEDNAFTKLKLGIQRHGYVHWKFNEDYPAADQWIEFDKELWLHEGEVLLARFTGTTSGDKLLVHVDGYWIKQGA